MPSTKRWAVILGVSSGTGAAIAREVSRTSNLHVFGAHRGHFPDEADRVAEAVRRAGCEIIFHLGDAGTADGAREGVAALRAAAGPRSVALMVHALAGASLGHFLPTRGDAFHPKQFEKTFNCMAHSFAYWAQALYENDLLAPGSRLLGLTNVLHESLLHNCGLVAAAKAALEMYVRHLALELGPHGHRVNLLKFGTVVTPALRTVLGPDAMQRLDDAHREMIPAGRMCTLEEVADFVAVLLRDECAWLNGATIDFSGGMTLRLLDLILRPA
jgi:NAD(P)-dependent dehydrogenase (short-subunit alcohol dehydrogenase family)